MNQSLKKVIQPALFTLAFLFAAGAASPAKAADAPVRMLSPSSAFLSSGDLDIKMFVAKGFYDQVLSTDLAEATIIVKIEGEEQPIIQKISDSGVVTPIMLNPRGTAVSGYYWDLSLDLSRFQCKQNSQIVYHCDGCGRSFQTGDAPVACTPKAVTITLQATNKSGNSVCTTDLNGDGTLDCAFVSGTLSPGIGENEVKYVPENFWETTSGAPVCITRSNSGAKGSSCKPIDR